MYHDFRIIERLIGGTKFYQVHRVFYKDAAKTNPYLVETKPATIIGAGAKVMLEDIEAMMDAFERQMLIVPEWDK